MSNSNVNAAVDKISNNGTPREWNELISFYFWPTTTSLSLEDYICFYSFFKLAAKNDNTNKINHSRKDNNSNNKKEKKKLDHFDDI